MRYSAVTATQISVALGVERGKGWAKIEHEALARAACDKKKIERCGDELSEAQIPTPISCSFAQQHTVLRCFRLASERPHI